MASPEQPLDLYQEDSPPSPAAERSSLFSPFGIVVGITALLLVAVVAWGINRNNQSQPRSGPAPDFSLPLLGQEGDFTLSEQRGQVVVINFWGSWCGPCRDEAPMLQQIYADYQAQGVIFLGIAVKDIESDSLAYIEEFGITYPNVMDMGGQAEDLYFTQGVPETFVVDKEGNIQAFFFARPSEAKLRGAIEAALES
jgi:cytochrome c biogenesis protein CcmG/thiol:disulfide interchange protein DsbE